MRYIACLTPDGSGGYLVRFGDLPGCTAHGRDFEDAVAAAHESLAFHLAALVQRREAIPPATAMRELSTLPGEIPALIDVPIGALRSPFAAAAAVAATSTTRGQVERNGE